MLIDAYTGNSALKDAIDGVIDSNPSFSSLYPITDGISPDDSFSVKTIHPLLGSSLRKGIPILNHNRINYRSRWHVKDVIGLYHQFPLLEYRSSPALNIL